MKEEFNWDSSAGFQVRECYELAQQYERVDRARSMIGARRKNVKLLDKYVTDQRNSRYFETDMRIASDIICSLTMEGGQVSEEKQRSDEYKVLTIKNIAEREFLLALLALRKGTSETQRVEALRHLTIANHNSPNDLRYITLINIISDAGK